MFQMKLLARQVVSRNVRIRTNIESQDLVLMIIRMMMIIMFLLPLEKYKDLEPDSQEEGTQTGYYPRDGLVAHRWATSKICKNHDFFSLNILIISLLYRIKGEHTF